MVTFNVGTNLRLPPEKRLGRWLSNNIVTNWRYSPREDSIYEEVENGWKAKQPVLERRGQEAQRQYYREGQPRELPEDATPTIC
eukprot:4478704-Ditylum_brightwellii.AAC.1